ncbi:hypothetical protein [Pseudomonas matsuisoli]|uniref:Membrane protein n=1 Tax=Pseudomonas matsuisoli TaxID=1515666 RepID=A0A917UZ10_9PSED|nr:hypothetical protein [Pseudomonas matsuisoli]GGJ99000.1 membrane protein [Pseudomonas matsuisoli]
MTRLIGLLLLGVGIAYPFAVYFGLQHLSPRVFAVLLGALWLLRAISPGPRALQRWMTVPVLAFCLLLGVADHEDLLRWYPVLVNLMLLTLFGSSLKIGMPVVERMARLREPALPAHAVRYTRRVTEVWVLFFIANLGITIGLTLWAPLAWWTLYTGLIAYLLMGALFLAEWLIRQRVRAAA